MIFYSILLFSSNWFSSVFFVWQVLFWKAWKYFDWQVPVESRWRQNKKKQICKNWFSHFQLTWKETVFQFVFHLINVLKAINCIKKDFKRKISIWCFSKVIRHCCGLYTSKLNRLLKNRWSNLVAECNL